MEENRKEGWKTFEECLASEIINGARRETKAIMIGTICVTAIAIVAVIGLLMTNHSNVQTFIGYLSEYDFVSQDGNGYNYYNSDIGGNVSNGAESPQEEEQEQR